MLKPSTKPRRALALAVALVATSPAAAWAQTGPSPTPAPEASCAVTLNGDPVAEHATQDRALQVDRDQALVVAAKSSRPIGPYEVVLTRPKFAATPASGNTGTSFSRSLRLDTLEPGVYSVGVVSSVALECLEGGFVDVTSPSASVAAKALLAVLALVVLLGARVAWVAYRRSRRRNPKGKHRRTR